MQAGAYGGYATLYTPEHAAAPIREAACWAHARRKFFEPADIDVAARRKAQGRTAVVSPMAWEAVRRMDAVFEIERVSGDTANCPPDDMRN